MTSSDSFPENNTDLQTLLEETRQLSRNKQFEEAIKRLEHSPLLDRNDRLLADLSYNYYMIANYEIASAYASKALALNPFSRRALSVSGEVCLKRADYDHAVMFFEDAHKHYPDDPYIANRLAHACLALDNPQKAIPVLQRTLESHPDNLNLLRLQQYIYMVMNDRDSANRIQHILDRLRFENPDAAISNLSEKIFHLETEKAIESLKAILNLPTYKNNPVFLEQLTQLMIKQKQYSDALPYLESLVQLKPRNDHFRLRLVDCLTRAGEPEAALKHLESLKSRHRDSRVILSEIEARAALGEHQAAMDMGVAYLIENPRDKRARSLLNRLRKLGIKPGRHSFEADSKPTP